MAAGEYVVAATSLGFAPAMTEPIVIASASERTGLDLSLDAGGTLVSGAVADSDGGPVAGARVIAREDRGSPALVAISNHGGGFGAR